MGDEGRWSNSAHFLQKGVRLSISSQGAELSPFALSQGMGHLLSYQSPLLCCVLGMVPSTGVSYSSELSTSLYLHRVSILVEDTENKPTTKSMTCSQCTVKKKQAGPSSPGL